MRLGTCALLLLASALCLAAADGDRTVLSLHLNRNILSFSGRTVEFSEPGVMGQGKVAGLTVNTARSSGKPGAYVVRLEDEGNKPAPVELVPDVPVRVEIDRPAGRLPYRLALLRETDSKGMSIERMTWQAEYRAEGTLAVGACRALLAIWDMTLDGVFDRRDFRAGSAVGIDLNGDGKIFGRGEYVFGGEVFEFCGRRFFVDPDSLKPDGSAVTLVETALERPKLGTPVPALILESTDGATLRSGDWKGKIVLLDFWAAWCGYCIEGFKTVKQLQDEFAPGLQVISINTDEPADIPAAKKVVASHDMPWPRVMSGKGLNDPVWMMFQALDHSLPQYVIIDRQGIVRYSGSGGENLAELRAAVEKHRSNR